MPDKSAMADPLLATAGSMGATPATAADLVDRHFLRRGKGPEFAMEVGWVRRHLRRTRMVLDLGCGNGALASCLEDLHVVGVDHLQAGLARTASEGGRGPFVCADVGRLPFRDGATDAVVLQHLIEHLDDPLSTLKGVFGVLKPAGILMILTPNGWFSDSKTYEDDSHRRIFTPRDLPDLVRQAGFVVSQVVTLGVPWFQSCTRWRVLWRLRRLVLKRAEGIAWLPGARYRGQTLCCAARRP